MPAESGEDENRASRLRLWRCFLGWILSAAFVWEAIGRPIIVSCWPHIVLPPSAMREVYSLLLGLLGLGI